MAIIEELGLKVEVRVNGSTAAEYPDEEPDVDVDPDADEHGQTTKACHHYIESIDNAEFSIHARLIPGTNAGREWVGLSPDHAMKFSVSFDGGPYARTMHVYQQETSSRMTGIRNEENQTLRKFRFAPVSTVDDANKDRITADMKVAQNLGLIRVDVHRGIWKKRAGHKTASRHGARIGEDSLALAEKALKGKAISHGAALSAPVQCARKPNDKIGWHFGTVDRGAPPLAVFYFKYRSKGKSVPTCALSFGMSANSLHIESLHQEMIIARPRSLSVDFDLGKLSRDEIRRLAIERLSQMKDGKKRAVKDEDDAEVVKSERPFKYVRIEGGKKAIDLTEDD